MVGRSVEPVAIDANADEQTLAVEWSDGHRGLYRFEDLRWACPCASCRGEMGRPGELDTTERLRPEQYELEDIHQVGRYAICPIWTDGHSTGIYTYAYLRRLCPCAVCRAEREAAADGT